MTHRAPVDRERARRRVVFLAVTALGISSIVTQLTLMRELLAVLSGNELVLGIVLGVWLLATGLGAALGGWGTRLHRPLAVLYGCQLTVAVLPIGSLVAVRVLRDAVFVRGAELGLTETLVGVTVVLLPYCLVGGAVLTLASRLLARDDPASVGWVYLADNVGDILGGLLFTFVLVYVAGHVDALVLVGIVNLAAAATVAWFARWTVRAALALTLALVAGVGHLATDLDRTTLALQYHGARIVHHAYGAQGHVVVTERGGQLDFIDGGVVLFSSQQDAHAEQVAHLALAERPRAKRVLLVSGGVTGSARELLEWPVARVDYVELDPEVLMAARRFLPERLADPRLATKIDDGRRFIQRAAPHTYDVVILDLPDPTTSQLNRFYTQELFAEVHRVLTPGGVLELSIGHYENYVSEPLAAMLSTVHRTLRQVFARVVVLPVGDVTLLASDGPLTVDVAARLGQKARPATVSTEWLTPDALATELALDRLADVQRALVAEGPVNHDLRPVLYFQALRFWLARHPSKLGWVPLLVAAGLCVYLWRAGRVPAAVFTVGFGAAALEVVVLLAFQVVHGFVYRQLGLIITLFLVGLAVGAYGANRLLDAGAARSRRTLALLLEGAALFAAALPWVLGVLDRWHTEPLRLVSAFAVFPGLVLVLGALVGAAFPVAAHADFRGGSATAARLYTADFLGAAAGALVVGTVALPLLGVTGVCAVTAGASLLVATLLLAAR